MTMPLVLATSEMPSSSMMMSFSMDSEPKADGTAEAVRGRDEEAVEEPTTEVDTPLIEAGEERNIIR